MSEEENKHQQYALRGVQTTLNSISTMGFPTHNGYFFDGWSDEDRTVFYDDGAENVTFEQDTDLYANWNVEQYTIDYVLDPDVYMEEEDENPAYYTVRTETFTIKNPKRNGYIFTGWTGSNGDQPQTEVTIQKGTTGDKQYTANWIQASITISFNANLPTGDGITFPSTIQAPSDITKYVNENIGDIESVGVAYNEGNAGSGYQIKANKKTGDPDTQFVWKFIGWFTDSTGGQEVTSTDSFSQNTTLYAHWRRRPCVRLNIQYGDQGNGRYKKWYFIDYGKCIGDGLTGGLFPGYSRNGYDFIGWYSQSDPLDAQSHDPTNGSDSLGEYFKIKYRSDTSTSSNLRKFYVSVDPADSEIYSSDSTGKDGNGNKANTTNVYNIETQSEVPVGGVPRLVNFVPTKNTILYAHWKPQSQQYQTTYHSNFDQTT